MRNKLFLLPALGLAGILFGFLVYSNLNQNLLYWVTPTEAVSQRAELPEGRRLRLGGQVVPGTVRTEGDGVRFVVTDGTRQVEVLHRHQPQQLFREGIGVVVEGSWEGDRFVSDTMIVRHEEEYRVPEGQAAP